MKTNSTTPRRPGPCLLTVAILFALALWGAGASAQVPPGGPGPQPPQGIMPPGPGGSGPGDMQPQPPLSEKDAQETLSQIKEEDPDLYQELLNIKDRDKTMYDNILSNYRRESEQLERLKQDNPSEYENALKVHDLNKQERQLSHKYRDATSEADRKMIELDLKRVLDQLFDLNLAMRQKEVEMLENRLGQVKDEIEKRKSHKSEIIERHFEEITGNADIMRW